jgi:hypothetical protein
MCRNGDRPICPVAKLAISVQHVRTDARRESADSPKTDPDTRSAIPSSLARIAGKKLTTLALRVRRSVQVARNYQAKTKTHPSNKKRIKEMTKSPMEDFPPQRSTLHLTPNGRMH